MSSGFTTKYRIVKKSYDNVTKYYIEYCSLDVVWTKLDRIWDTFTDAEKYVKTLLMEESLGEVVGEYKL